MTVKIDYSKCDNCGECILICPKKVFTTKNNKVIIENPENCNQCHACEIACHKQAIIIEE